MVKRCRNNIPPRGESEPPRGGACGHRRYSHDGQSITSTGVAR